MDYELKNARYVQPTVSVVTMFVKSSTVLIPRGADISVTDVVDATEIPLTKKPLLKSWVEVYVDGFRVVNPSFDFGITHRDFEVMDDRIVFHQPVTGSVRIIVDYQANSLIMPKANSIVVKNRQGARTKATNPGELFAAYFCTPMILTLPENGFVRVSDDGCSLTYFPDRNYTGYDAFSYTVITERGQIAEPKCANVKIS